MSFTDRLGLPLATTSAVAAEAYNDAADRQLAGLPGAGARVADALAADGEFALAHALAARLHQIYGRRAQALDAAALARRCAQGAGAFERGHVEAIALLVEGKSAASLAQVRAHLADYPLDSLVLSLALSAFGLIAMSGNRAHDAERLALCESLAPDYREDWWFLAFLGWGHTEAGDPARGRDLARASLEQRPDFAHAVHSLCHASCELGTGTDGLELLDRWLPGYHREGMMHCHLSWHHALFALDEGQHDRARDIFVRECRPATSASPPINVLTDAVGFLWRLGLRDLAAPAGAWQEARDHAHRWYPDAAPAFVAVFCAMAEAMQGDGAALTRRIERLEAQLAAGQLPQGAMAPRLCHALAAFAGGEFGRAADLLAPIAADIVGLAGSHAQREVFEDTRIVACLRAGRSGEARELIAARLARRPSRWDEENLRSCG